MSSKFAKSAIVNKQIIFLEKINMGIIKIKLDFDSGDVEKQKCSPERNYWVKNVVPMVRKVQNSLQNQGQILRF